MEDTGITKRKSDHIEIVLDKDVSSGISTGLEAYSFLHCALPELNLAEVDLSTRFLSKDLRVPLLISSMTGGTSEAQKINENLARAAQRAGIAMGVGSQRAAIENPNRATATSFNIRKFAPDIPVLANLGAIQLNYGFGVDQCKRAVEMIDADALILHLNPLQEALQPEGNTNWQGVDIQIEKVVKQLGYPVIMKEVGWGISPELVKRFFDMGVYAVDIAGAGGTSWSQVEMHRLHKPEQQRVAAAFDHWGIPTADAIRMAKDTSPEGRIIASGGLKDGIDIAKCLGLGAVLGGMAGIFLKAASQSEEAVSQKITEIQSEIRICMFAAGIKDIKSLISTNRLVERA
jgi:isopentenyl-diphosphate Delta-isomerase